jgi:DNA polymerase-3 subunit delta
VVAVRNAGVDAFLKRPEPAVICFLLYGPDAGLVGERARVLAAQVVPADDPFGLVKLDGDAVAADPGRLLDEGRSVPMFGGGRVVWVTLGDRQVISAVEALLAEPAVTARVILAAGELRRGDRLRALCEKSPRAAALPCYADSEAGKSTLIDQVLAEFGLTIAPEARRAALALLGPDRLLARSELEKLGLYAMGGGPVGADAVEAAMADAGESETEALVDAVFSGNLAAVDVALAAAGPTTTAATAPLMAALNHALRLYRLSLEIAAGGGSAEAVLNRGWPTLHFSRQDRVKAALTRLGPDRLATLVARLAEAVAEGRRNGLLADALARRALTAAAGEAARR